MLQLLGPEADAATGIDRSPEMLRIARARLDAAGLGRFEVRHADMAALPLADASVDTVVIHQVLHFSDSGTAAIAEAARVLAPGGQLLVVDHAAHGEEELRDRFRHVRLGFSDAAMAEMLAAAGLSKGARVVVEGPRIPVHVWQGVKPCPKP
jgi:ArsR family transcriptional regulator